MKYEAVTRHSDISQPAISCMFDSIEQAIGDSHYMLMNNSQFLCANIYEIDPDGVPTGSIYVVYPDGLNFKVG